MPITTGSTNPLQSCKVTRKGEREREREREMAIHNQMSDYMNLSQSCVIQWLINIKRLKV